jgi:hypothetical protein
MSLPILDVPTYELEVPSTKLKVKYRPFLVKEHKVLMTLAEADVSEVSRVIKQLIDVCTFNKLNIDKLSNFDVEYIFLSLRSKSIGELVKVIVNCTCGNEINHTIDLNNIVVDKSKSVSNKIQIRENVGMVLRYPTFEEMLELYENKDNVKVFLTISKCINSIYTGTDSYERDSFTDEEADDFLSQLTKEEFNKIEEFFVNLPKVTQHIEALCDKCGKVNKTKLEGLQNFFV